MRQKGNLFYDLKDINPRFGKIFEKIQFTETGVNIKLAPNVAVGDNLLVFGHNGLDSEYPGFASEGATYGSMGVFTFVGAKGTFVGANGLKYRGQLPSGEHVYDYVSNRLVYFRFVDFDKLGLPEADPTRDPAYLVPTKWIAGFSLMSERNVPVGKPVNTTLGKVPEAKSGISNPETLPNGTSYGWSKVPDVATPGQKRWYYPCDLSR